MNQRELELARRKRIWRGFRVFLFVWPAISLVTAFIPDQAALDRGQTSFEFGELATRFAARLVIGLPLGLVVFGALLLVKGSRWSRVATVLCERCGTVKRYDDRSLCDCGGLFVDIERMKWVEDQTSADPDRASGSEGG